MKRQKHSDHFLMGAGALTIAVLFICNILIFRNFRDNLLSLQEDHMLTTAKSVANNLKNYYDGELENFNLYFDRELTREQAVDYCQKRQEITSVSAVSQDGVLLWTEGLDYTPVLGQVLDTYRTLNKKQGDSQAKLLPPVLTSERHFTQFLVKPVSLDGSPVWLLATMETESIYDLIVKPIQIGKDGYSMAKNYDGLILMHKSKNQLVIEAVDGRREQYREYDLNLEDLEAWVMEQKTSPEGSRILNSYWWEDGKAPAETKKVVAYTQVPIGEETWIINCTLNYEELLEPIQKAQRYVFLVAALLLLAFGGLLKWSINHAEQSRTMELEMKHLAEMNSAWEELHRREEQIRHKDKIQTLGTMTSMISHEFNNFLTPVMLYGEMLEADPDISEENRMLLREMVTSAGRAKELTKELSRYGHSGKGSGKKIRLHVTDEINRSLKMIGKTMPSNICLEKHLASDEGYGVMGSAGMINQVIVNLCNNAIHAMRDTGGCITVKGSLLEEGPSVRYAITVSDNGPGIPEEVQKQIFTPFFTTKKQGEGTGLGLSVVQDLIHEVSGEINMVSVVGTGTRFDILLPVSRISEETEQIQVGDGLKACSILILDDDSRVGNALGKALKPYCRKEKVFTRPEEALAEIKNDLNRWNVIVTDYTMPMMNGLEFAGILRSLGFTGTILLISGNLDKDVEWYQDNGIVDAVLEKPVTIKELEKAVGNKCSKIT